MASGKRKKTPTENNDIAPGTSSNRSKNYWKWSEKEHYEIGKYVVKKIYGSRAAESFIPKRNH